MVHIPGRWSDGEAGTKHGQRLAAKETFGLAQSWPWNQDQKGHTCAYTSLDFVSVPQQGPDGAKAESRMAAVAMIYNPQPEQKETPKGSSRGGCPTSRGGCPVRFLSGLYELDKLGLHLRRQAAQVGWDEAHQQLALCDAGNGLEDFAFRNFPLAEPILDFYHASEHVAALVAACHPGDAAAAAEQTTAWCHQLKHAGGAALLRIESPGTRKPPREFWEFWFSRLKTIGGASLRKKPGLTAGAERPGPR